MFVGAYVGGAIVDMYPPGITIKTTVKESPDASAEVKEVILPNWDDKKDKDKGLAKVIGLKDDELLSPDKVPDSYVETNEKTKGTRTFMHDDLVAAIKRADLNGDGAVSRLEWRTAQRKDWFHIWLWPALAALVTCGLFWVGFKSPAKPVAENSAGA